MMEHSEVHNVQRLYLLLKEENAVEKFIRGVYYHSLGPNFMYRAGKNMLPHQLIDSIYWLETVQGYDFWQRLAEKAIEKYGK